MNLLNEYAENKKKKNENNKYVVKTVDRPKINNLEEFYRAV